MQKKYQQLRSEGNKEAARLLYKVLKKDKVISQARFDSIYMEANSIRWKHGSFNSLWETTFQFLTDHGLVTLKSINGLNIYVATQKCFRTKSFANATKEVQITSNVRIDKAIAYVITNDNMVPAEFEGPIVANFLGLEGKAWKYFVESYKYNEDWNNNDHCGLPIKFKVLSVVSTMEHEGLLKKV
jgi:hypothetical protein